MQRVDIDVECIPESTYAAEVLAVHEALYELEQHGAQVPTPVKLCYLAGMSYKEVADALCISRSVADRLWAVGRAWRHQKLTENGRRTHQRSTFPVHCGHKCRIGR